MPGRPTEPPQRYPITELRTPNNRDWFLTELFDRTDPAYQRTWPIPRGTPYASMIGADVRIVTDTASNPLYLLKVLRPGNSSSSDFGSTHDFLIFVWASVPAAQDTYNAAISYVDESTGVPRYVREYVIRRVTYEATPTLTPGTAIVTGLLSVNITAGGAGYTSATGTIATGATVQFVCFNGQLIDGIVTNEGTGVMSGGGISITGDGAGGAASARIQPASAVLIHQEKQELPEDDPRSHDYVKVIRVYQTEPTAALTTQIRSEMFNGEIVYEVTQEGLAGTLPPESGAGVIESTTKPIDTVRERRVSRKFSSAVTPPATQTIVLWRYIGLPLLVFDIVPNVFCNETPYFKVVTDYETAFGSSQWRKHRVTFSYSFTAPDPNLSASSFETLDIRYQGVVIAFSFNNALCDHLTFSGDAYLAGGGCFWTEEWDFPATTPSATDFYAGDWYVESYVTKQLGPGLWMSTKIEYYSAPGNPSI